MLLIRDFLPVAASSQRFKEFMSGEIKPAHLDRHVSSGIEFFAQNLEKLAEKGITMDVLRKNERLVDEILGEVHFRNNELKTFVKRTPAIIADLFGNRPVTDILAHISTRQKDRFYAHAIYEILHYKQGLVHFGVGNVFFRSEINTVFTDDPRREKLLDLLDRTVNENRARIDRERAADRLTNETSPAYAERKSTEGPHVHMPPPVAVAADWPEPREW